MGKIINLRQALLNAGWSVLDSKTSPRAYADESGQRFGTVEKDGVRVSLSIGQEFVEERGAVIVYMSEDPSDAILRALIVDDDVRRQGFAKRALTTIAQLADATASTVYLEPSPIEDKPLGAAALCKLYGVFGFEFVGPNNRVMVRRPNEESQCNPHADTMCHIGDKDE